MLDKTWHSQANARRLRFFQKARQSRYERAIEDDAFAVKLFDKTANERLQIRRDRLGITQEV